MLISSTVTAQLIFAFVFAYAKSRWFITSGKSHTNKSLLMERAVIIAARIQFLCKIKQYHENDTNETFVPSSQKVNLSLQSSEVSLKVPFSRGERLIILHAGQKAGSLKETEQVWKAISITGDYHDKMNDANYMYLKWLKEILIPHLPPKSVLIINYEPYHNVQVYKCPTQASRKAEIYHVLQLTHATIAAY